MNRFGSRRARPVGYRRGGAVPLSRWGLLASRWGLVAIYVVFLGAYLGASGGRLRQHSQYNHFVYLAEGWLKGRLDMPVPPPNENDWARVEVCTSKTAARSRACSARSAPPIASIPCAVRR
jgi:hypothetical protein